LFHCDEPSSVSERVKPPIALFVGFGQGHPRHRFAQTEMVKRGRSFGVQAFLDIAQTLSPGQLRKAHADQLLPATKVSRENVVELGQAIQRLTINQIQDLGDDVAAGVHGRQSCKQAFPTSNPSRRFCRANPSS
jgi:hypothetical protein